ncbi:MAG: LysR family transcriptional regulator [Actinomycetota bacterium]|nr:LysR family transcriptional regulator [Actinomycetota bacterium]
MLRDVETKQLRALLAVAEEGSFGRAAERLGFTQSAISQQIASLERVVGDKVFDRPGGPKRVELTPTGEVVLRYATSMLAELRIAEDNLRSLRAGEVGRLVVGSFQSISVNVLPTVVGQLRSERPGLAVRCVEDDENDSLVARLLADELDLTFLIGDPRHPDLHTVALLVDPFVLVTPGSAGAPDTNPAALDGVAMIGQSPCACQLAIDESLREFGVVPDYVFRSNDNSAVQAMVRAGMGCAILPHLAVDAGDPGVVVSQLQPPLPPRVIVLARRRGRTLPPAADRFAELAISVCQALQLPEYEPQLTA